MKCPNCGFENPESAKWCACGYDFQKKEMMETPPYKLLWEAKEKRKLSYHLSYMILASYVVFFSDGLLFWGSQFRVSLLDLIAVGAFMVGVPIAITSIPAGIYWFIKRSFMPGLRFMMWTLWVMSAFLVTIALLADSSR